MAKTKLNLYYSLVPNTLPETDGCHAAVSHVGTVDAETFFARVAKRRAGLDASTAELVLSSVCTTVAETLQERQYRVALGDVSFELAIPGSTDSVDGAMAGPAYVAVRPSAAIRNAAADVTPVYSAGDGVRTEVFSVEDLATCSPGEIVGTGAFRLAGCNISASGEDESVTVTAADGTRAVAVVESEDGTGSFITAHLPSALPPGKGTVTLKTCGKRTPEGELRTLSKSVTIIAGETPPGPVGPTVTAINDGTFHAGAGNVITGANMRFADAFPGNHILIKDAQGTDMEAMISTDAEIPVTETRFALNLDEGQPLTDGEEYTFAFDMVDGDGQPVTVTHVARWRAS